MLREPAAERWLAQAVPYPRDRLDRGCIVAVVEVPFREPIEQPTRSEILREDAGDRRHLRDRYGGHAEIEAPRRCVGARRELLCEHRRIDAEEHERVTEEDAIDSALGLGQRREPGALYL